MGESKGFVERQVKPENFPLFNGSDVSPLWVDPADHSAVIRAVGDLKADVLRVTEREPKVITNQASEGKFAVVIGTLGKSDLIQRLVDSKKIDASALVNQWESFMVTTVRDPFPGVEQALVIVGSDRRGTIYGIYELSEQMGVSPWYWWADVPVIKASALSIKPGVYHQKPPAVKYRGFFINDEDPCLNRWVKANFGKYDHKFYGHVFELLLRLRANYLWPAMWGNNFWINDKENAKTANDYGIVMGTSHHELMMRSSGEWSSRRNGPWNFATNSEKLIPYWTKGIERSKDFEKLITIGMRANDDSAMADLGSMQANADMLEKVVKTQRKIIGDVMQKDPSEVPQVWSLYKEVTDYYEHGMRVPNDVTLVWCDDNYGNIRRVPTPEERKRAGGAGIYYHFDYFGMPRSYKWMNSNPLPKIWEQMSLAYEHGANRLWIVNVGDIKPMELPIDFFLSLAWDPAALPKEKIGEFTKEWATRQFGAQYATEIASLLSGYAKHNGWRRPEGWEPTTFSLIDYNEVDRVREAWKKLDLLADEIWAKIPAEQRDAYFQLVAYPVKACAALNAMYTAVGKNHLYASQGRRAANRQAEQAQKSFEDMEKLDAFYNEEMAGGKWNHMADEVKTGYKKWHANGKVDVLPDLAPTIKPSTTVLFGVAVEGQAEAWPESRKQATLPIFDALHPVPAWIDVFAKSDRAFSFTAKADQSWVKIRREPVPGSDDFRLWVDVDWRQVAASESRAVIKIEGHGISIPVSVNARQATRAQHQAAEGSFGSLVGVISIAAQDGTPGPALNGVRWEAIPDYGRGSAGMAPFPMNSPSAVPPKAGPVLTYPIFIGEAGDYTLDLITSPSMNILPNRGLRIAVSVDDENPMVLDAYSEEQKQKRWVDNDPEWSKMVVDNARTMRTKLRLNQPGKHELKITMIDTGIVLQKLILSKNKLPDSYFGPPEAPRVTAAP